MTAPKKTNSSPFDARSRIGGGSEKKTSASLLSQRVPLVSSRRSFASNLLSEAANGRDPVSTRGDGGRPRAGAGRSGMTTKRTRASEKKRREPKRGGRASRLAASRESSGEIAKSAHPPNPDFLTLSRGWARAPFSRTSRRRPFRAWSRAGRLSNQREGARDAGGDGWEKRVGLNKKSCVLVEGGEKISVERKKKKALETLVTE